MIGALLGTAMSAAGAIYGGIKNQQTYKAMRDRVEQGQAAEQNYYDREYNADETQRASAQKVLTMTEESIRNRNRAATGADAMNGGSGIAAAQAREQNNQALAQAASTINAQGQARKDVLTNQHQAKQQAYDNQLAQMDAAKMQATAAAIGGVADAAGNIMNALPGKGTNLQGV